MFSGDTRWLEGLFTIIVDNSVEFVVLGLMAGVLDFALRRKDPRIRHAIWLTALLWLAVPLDPPLPWTANSDQVADYAFAEVVSTGRGLGLPPVPALLAEPREVTTPSRAPGGESQASAVDEPSSQPVAEGSSPSTAGGLLRGFAWLWMVGAGLALGTLGARLLLAERLRKRGVADVELDRISASVGASLGLRRNVPVRRVEPEPGDRAGRSLGPGPVLVGLLRPTILVPTEAVETWDENELRSAIAHELVHVSRLDHWTSWLQRLITAIFFFHPLVWWASRRLAFERELCCDDRVMARPETPPRSYLNALMHSATAGRMRAPVLGVAGHNSHVSRRIRRMTDANYDLRKRRPLVAVCLISLFFLVAGMLVAGAPRTASDDAATATATRVSAIVVYPSYFAANAEGEVDWDRPLPVNGDIEIGRPASRLGLGEIEIDPLVSGQLAIRVRVAPDGALHDARLEGSLDPAFDEQVLQRVRAATWIPSRHKERGPVGMEMVVRASVAPADLARDRRPTMGEVAEALPFDWPVDGLGDRPERTVPPTYLPVRARSEFDGPSLTEETAATFEGDYSFIVQILEDGQVGMVESLGNTVPRAVQSSNWESMQAVTNELSSWIRSFTFDPPVDDQGERRVRAALLDVRVEGTDVRVATFAPVAETWRSALEPVYRLEEGQALKIIPREQMGGLASARLEMYRAFDVRRGRGRIAAPSVLHLDWTDGALSPTIEGACHGGCELFSSESAQTVGNIGAVTRAFPFTTDRFEVVTAEDTSYVIGPGDVIWRKGATREQLLSGLVAEFERILDVPVTWEDASVMRTALVLRGQLGEIAEDPALPGQRMLHVYRDEKESDPRSGSGFSTASNGASLARALEMFLRLPVVDETVGAPVEQFTVRMHRSAWTEAMDEVAANVAAQTGLEVFVAERPVDAVRIVLGDDAQP